MEFAGEEFSLLPGLRGERPPKDKNKTKDQKLQVWLAGELIIRAEHQCLTSLPQQLFSKTTVRKLILTGNQLDSLPLELFQQLKELRELRVGHNQLTYLPEDVQCLVHLETLDVQHNQLKLVPASLFKCVHLKVLNLNGNPLCSWLRELWPEPQAGSSEDAAATAGGGSQGQEATSAAVLQQLKANTRALLDHLLQAQDPEVQLQVQQARLAVLQAASRARLNKLLLEVDGGSLAECQRIATEAQLGQDVLDQVQQRQEAAQAMQAAADAVQQCLQLQQQGGTEDVPADLRMQLAACLSRVEELCKPARPAGKLYPAAHDLLRKLQRQQQERGWRCSAAPSLPSASEPAALDAAAGGGQEGGSVSPGPRRFLTSAERVRQQLAGAGAKTHKEWAMLKQQAEARQRQLIKELARAEKEGHNQVVAERAAKAVNNAEREQHWPSRRVEAYPPGTFSLGPQVLKAVRKAYYKTPPLPEL